MASISAESLKDTWTMIFRRRGGRGDYCGLFESLHPSQRELLLDQVPCGETELPVIGSIRSSDNWLILTTDRLVWSHEGKRTEVAKADICNVKVDLIRLRYSGRPPHQMNQLLISTFHGSQYTIELEPGKPVYGVLYILMNLKGRNSPGA